LARDGFIGRPTKTAGIPHRSGKHGSIDLHFWDGEHRFPNNVGPEGLRPTKAWEIHPIKLLAER